MDDEELYERGLRTVAACWAVFAESTRSGEVHRLPHAVVAVFADEPERSIYNNAIPKRGLPASECAAALETIEELYASAAVERFAAWAHETDEPLQESLRRRGYVVDAETRAMGMPSDDVAPPRPGVSISTADWSEHVRLVGAPPALLNRLDTAGLDVLVASVDGENLATGLGFDHDGDCGIYNVATLEHARRRGLGTALTSALVNRAVARGCRTASLQSTPVAERMYAALGFRDLGRIVEYVPARRR